MAERKKRKRVTEPEALAIYLKLGERRSYRKLRKVCGDNGAMQPTFRTLVKWANEKDWKGKAEKYDADVAAGIVEAAVHQTVVEAADVLKALNRFSATALKRAAELAHGDVNMNALVDNAIKAFQQAEVMTGGVSDRTEAKNDQTVRLDAAAKKLEDDLAKRYGFEKGCEPENGDDAATGDEDSSPSLVH